MTEIIYTVNDDTTSNTNVVTNQSTSTIDVITKQLSDDTKESQITYVTHVTAHDTTLPELDLLISDDDDSFKSDDDDNSKNTIDTTNGLQTEITTNNITTDNINDVIPSIIITPVSDTTGTTDTTDTTNTIKSYNESNRINVLLNTSNNSSTTIPYVDVLVTDTEEKVKLNTTPIINPQTTASARSSHDEHINSFDTTESESDDDDENMSESEDIDISSNLTLKNLLLYTAPVFITGAIVFGIVWGFKQFRPISGVSNLK